MKKIYLFLIALLLCNCGGPLNKSVLEPLSLDELKAISKKDTSFISLYQHIESVRSSLHTDVEKVKWSDLTYKRILKFIKLTSDTVRNKAVAEKAQQEWEAQNAVYQAKVDSASNYWKKFKEENSLDRYVTIELAEIETKYYAYIQGVSDVNLGFRLTPLQGTVEKIKFKYRILEKQEEPGMGRPWDYTACESDTPLEKPTVRYWKADLINKKTFAEKSVGDFLTDYKLFILVDEIRVNGQDFSVESLGIPKSLEMHWANENDETYLDIYRYDVVKELFDPEYKRQWEYVMDKLEAYWKTKDELSCEFWFSATDLDLD